MRLQKDQFLLMKSMKPPKNRSLEEAFGTGTAVGIAMIQEIGYKGKDIHVSNESPVGQMVLETINGVRTGEILDHLNWMCKIKI